MDSTAYLVRQGWRGKGHALHYSGRGIKKPLLFSKKSDALGVGLKKVDPHADQWWARAFDSGLKNLNLGKDGEASDKTEEKAVGALHLMTKGAGKWTGLYDNFVQGQTLRSTFENSSIVHENVEVVAVKIKKSRKRKADVLNGAHAASSKESKANGQKERNGVSVKDESNEERKPKKKEKKEKEEKKEKKEKKKKENAGLVDEASLLDDSTLNGSIKNNKSSDDQLARSKAVTEDVQSSETERAERKRRRREKKRLKMLRGGDT